MPKPRRAFDGFAELSAVLVLLRLTLTYDQGKADGARHKEPAVPHRTCALHFADPHGYWQGGSN